MSQWTDRILQHAVITHLHQFSAALDDAEAAQHTDSQAVEHIDRLRAVERALRRVLDGTDPALVSTAPFDGIVNSLSTIVQQIQAYASRLQLRYLVAANQHADGLLTFIPQLGPGQPPDGVGDLRDAVVSLRRSIGQHLKNVEVEVSGLRATVQALDQQAKALDSQLAAQQAQVGSALSQFQAQFSAAQDERLKQFTAAQAEQQKGFHEAERSRTEAFDHAMSNRTQALEALTAEHTERFTGVITRIENAWETLGGAIRDQRAAQDQTLRGDGEQLLADLRGFRTQAEELLGVIGTSGVTSGYKKAADDARSSKILWQRATVAAMIGLIGMAAFVFLPLTTNSFTWESFAGRVFVSLTIGVLAAYAAHQADRHHTAEVQNRRLELELASIGPYLAPLSAEKQEEFKLLMAERTFGRTDAGVASDGKASPATMLDLLKNKDFLDTLATMAKAIGKGNS